MILPHACNGRFADSDWKGSFSYMAFTSCLLLFLLYIGFCTIRITGKVNVLFVEEDAPIVFRVNEKFLSIGLDSSVIARGFNYFNISNAKLVKMIGHLSPAYLRVGGNLADRLIFAPDNKTIFKAISHVESDGGDCSNMVCHCEYYDKPNFTMNGLEWLKLNNLSISAKLDMVFDLNVLRRSSNDSWDPTNAEELIAFSDQHELNLDWQLGNEPNAFRHQFNYEVNATQLAADFGTLKKILSKYERYTKSALIGPDTTRPDPKHKESVQYIVKFLRHAGDVIDIISWHQYYFNGRTVDAHDFLDPAIFDVLTWQIEVIQKIKSRLLLDKKMVWLGETSSAWGGGSSKFSDRFIASFIWLDKLGLAAKLGIDVVVRQSIFQGYYALIADNYKPNPDYWISILYKQLVGQEVLSCYNVASQKVRLYCHCSKRNVNMVSLSSVTVFGMNMQETPAKIRIEGFNRLEGKNAPLLVLSYVLTAKETLLSKDVYLNGEILLLTSTNDLPNFKPKVVNARPYLIMPPFSIVFWVVPTETKICVG